MNIRKSRLLPIVIGALLSAGASAHQVSNIEHSHAFQQTGYGAWRQGHYVDGPQGSILIWSPRTYTGYQTKSQVKFARPVPITRAPSGFKAGNRAKLDPVTRYGKPR